MERNLDFKRIAAVDGFALLLSSAAGISAAAGGWGRSALLLGGNEPALVLFTAQAVGNIILGPRQGPTAFVRLRELRWFAGFSRGFWVGAQFVPVTLHWDRLVIGFFLGPAMAGLYDIAGRLAYLPMRLVQNLIGRVMLPFYARIQNDKSRLSRLLLTQLQLVGYLTTLYFVAFFVADSLGWPTLLLGDQWASVGWLVQGLSVAGLLRAMLFTIWPALIATGQPWALARYNIVLASALLVLAPPLAMVYGVAGVMVAVTIAGALSLLMLIWTMDPPWVGNSSALPTIVLPLLALALGVVATFALPRGVAWVAWLVIAVLSAVSAGRGSAVILRLIGRVRPTASA
jgi:O-antigen/teichoic acid export membrane protein